MRDPTRYGYCVLVFLTAAAPLPLSAESFEPRPDAIVEEVSGADGLQPLQVLHAGRHIGLGQNGRLVLGYLGSCWEETIIGGDVWVENRQSRVERGSVTRRRVDCDSTALTHWHSGPEDVGSVPGPISTARAETPDIVVFGTSPVLLCESGFAAVTISRLDLGEPAIRVELVDGKLDLLDRGIELEPGGLYRFGTDSVSLIVLVDELAQPGRAPLIGRLVFLPDQSDGRHSSTTSSTPVRSE